MRAGEREREMKGEQENKTGLHVIIISKLFSHNILIVCLILYVPRF